MIGATAMLNASGLLDAGHLAQASWAARWFDDAVAPTWVMIGLGGQGLAALCLLIEWSAARRRQTRAVGSVVAWFAVVGAIGLLAYAVVLENGVFIVGQSIHVLVFLRFATALRARRPRPGTGLETRGFPMVEPDKADSELNLPQS